MASYEALAERGSFGTLTFGHFSLDIGDFLLLVTSHPTSDTAVVPTGWTEIVSTHTADAQWVIAYRLWGDDNSSTEVSAGNRTTVMQYRGTPTGVSATTDSAITVVDSSDLLIDCVFVYDAESPSTFDFDSPEDMTARKTHVFGSVGHAVADTIGFTLVPGSRPRPTWTQGGGDPLPAGSTVSFATIRLRPIGWGVGQIRMGAN